MGEPVEPQRVTVYCASSRKADPAYRDAARELGTHLARAGIAIVYGGGAVGSMGALADGAAAAAGRIEGVIPRFMYDLEWAHPRLTELHVVEDLHERKRRMLAESDAVIALPGGCGTLEELFEAITWKRLGLFGKPIVLVDTRGFFRRCVDLLEHCVDERFMGEKHRAIWTRVDTPAEVLAAIRAAPQWPDDSRDFAVS